MTTNVDIIRGLLFIFEEDIIGLTFLNRNNPRLEKRSGDNGESSFKV